MGRYAAPPFNRVIEAPALMPPKVAELGHQSFTRHELELLALLVWPVELHPGVWLPAIWSEASWRVRPPIDTVERYGAFVELIVGFLRSIDRGLMQTPATFESCQ
jgi:hypothetical protein